MASNPSLAIVIPAYKWEFLSETLDSIAEQTNKNFTLYIGDDASSYGLNQIVDRYRGLINIIYKRFDANLGGKDLVAQWNRCIEMTQGEEWIWMFSDDDIMEANCVEAFYKHIAQHPTASILHFDVEVISEHDSSVLTYRNYPRHLDASEFFQKRIRHQINSFVVEYIFRRNSFQAENGFEKFDLAWCTDDATWIKLARTSGIKTIPGAKVKWRYSGANISSIKEDEAILTRKLSANIDYINWVKNFFSLYSIRDATSDFEKLRWVLEAFKNSSISLAKKLKLLNSTINRLGYKNMRYKATAYLLYSEIKTRYINKKS